MNTDTYVGCVRELPVMDVCLRHMEDSDIAYVMECMEEAALCSVTEEERAESDRWMPALRKTVAALYDGRRDNEIFILWKKNERIGMIWLGLWEDEFTHVPAGFLYGIYVREDMRRSGLARWMISFAEDWCLERGLNRLCLNVGSENEGAIRAYRSMGFRPRSSILIKKLR